MFDWIASFLIIFGALLTGLNIYPYNVFVQIIGSSMWIVSGIRIGNNALIFLNVFCVLMLVGGLAYGAF